MPDRWSRPYDAGQLADRRTDIDFSIPLAALQRLAPQLAGGAGNAQGRASFARERGLAVVDLEVDASVPLTCQRCLAPMAWPVASRAHIAIVADVDTADRVAPEFETVLAPDGRITVGDLVEEELLLSLPIVAMHADSGNCRAIAGGETGEETQKPFAGLAALLQRGPRPDEE
ncbi:MAG: hypothetical protein CMLOHMNK_00646 [Steroidobacteraceae bacterium]|nr:hypothetical protein [Steroidobacteraceae bacterium]